jgi:hypothetical protein
MNKTITQERYVEIYGDSGYWYIETGLINYTLNLAIIKRWRLEPDNTWYNYRTDINSIH